MDPTRLLARPSPLSTQFLPAPNRFFGGWHCLEHHQSVRSCWDQVLTEHSPSVRSKVLQLRFTVHCYTFSRQYRSIAVDNGLRIEPCLLCVTSLALLSSSKLKGQQASERIKNSCQCIPNRADISCRRSQTILMKKSFSREPGNPRDQRPYPGASRFSSL